MMKVILDTNALMIPGQFGVDIFSELNRLGFDLFIVPHAVVHELHRLKDTEKGKDKRAAKMALSFIDKCEIINNEDKNNEIRNADEIIVNLAIKFKAAVLTNDIDLKKRLCSKGITVVYLRQEKYLDI